MKANLLVFGPCGRLSIEVARSFKELGCDVRFWSSDPAVKDLGVRAASLQEVLHIDSVESLGIALKGQFFDCVIRISDRYADRGASGAGCSQAIGLGAEAFSQWHHFTDNLVFISSAYSIGAGPDCGVVVHADEATQFATDNETVDRVERSVHHELNQSRLNWCILRPSTIIWQSHQLTMHRDEGIVPQWFQLLGQCHAMAVQAGIPIVRIPVQPSAQLDLIRSEAVIHSVHSVVESLTTRDSQSYFANQEILLAGLCRTSMLDLLEAAYEVGAHRIQPDPCKPFVPTSVPERHYLRNAGRMLLLGMQNIYFSPTKMRSLLSAPGMERLNESPSLTQLAEKLLPQADQQLQIIQAFWSKSQTT